jgi:hypothetical protein
MAGVPLLAVPVVEPFNGRRLVRALRGVCTAVEAPELWWAWLSALTVPGRQLQTLQ